MADNLNTLILKVLNEGEHYGLDMIKRINETSPDVEVKQPSLYSALRRLEEKGFVESYWEDGQEGGRRHYYKITDLGLEELSLMTSVEQFKKQKNEPKLEGNEDADLPHPTAEELLKTDDKDLSHFNNTEPDIDDAPPFDIDDTQDNEDEVSQEIEPNECISDIEMPESASINENIEPMDDVSGEESEKDDEEDFYNDSSSGIEDFNPYADENEDDNNENDLSFTEQAQEYIPDESITEADFEESETNTSNDELPPLSKSEPKFNFDEEITNEKADDIDYKDILGDLEAESFIDEDEKDERTKIIESSISSMPTSQFNKTQKPIIASAPEPEEEKPVSRRSKYTDEVAAVFKKGKSKQNTSSRVPASPTFGRKDKNLDKLQSSNEKNALDEVASRYNLSEKVKNSKTNKPIQKLVSKNVNYNHIRQENIVIHPYDKKMFVKINTKKFIYLNRFNLFRAILMTIIFFVEMLLVYQISLDKGYYLSNHDYFYFVFGIFGIIYLFSSIFIYSSDINKKIYAPPVHWWKNFGIRCIYAALLAIFSIAICFCFGMKEMFNVDFYLGWLIPCIVAINFIISWIIGVLLNSIKAFRA